MIQIKRSAGYVLVLLALCPLFWAPAADAAIKVKLMLRTIALPDGFKISLYAADLPGARSLAVSPAGTVFVGTRATGRVYAVLDQDGDRIADRTVILADSLNMPNGVALWNGDLYVAEVHRILRYRQVEKMLGSPMQPEVVYDKLPKDRHHGWKFIRFGPDGRLYVPVGAPCNVCRRDAPVYASITRMNRDGSGFEIFAHGVRNTVGFDWHPQSRELWFTDNGRDWMGDDLPPDELNHAPVRGLHLDFLIVMAVSLPIPSSVRNRCAGNSLHLRHCLIPTWRPWVCGFTPVRCFRKSIATGYSLPNMDRGIAAAKSGTGLPWWT